MRSESESELQMNPLRATKQEHRTALILCLEEIGSRLPPRHLHHDDGRMCFDGCNAYQEACRVTGQQPWSRDEGVCDNDDPKHFMCRKAADFGRTRQPTRVQPFRRYPRGSDNPRGSDIR